MLPVNKYVDMQHPDFKSKNDFEIWHMLDDTTRLMIGFEYIAERMEKAILELGEKVGAAVIAVTATTVTKQKEKK